LCEKKIAYNYIVSKVTVWLHNNNNPAYYTKKYCRTLICKIEHYNYAAIATMTDVPHIDQ
jgi:hypothetical protein